MSDYGTARREFWENCFRMVWEDIEQERDEQDAINDAANIADAMLESWEYRWTVVKTESIKDSK